MGTAFCPGGMLAGFPSLWVLFEWLRSWLLTGFPWLYLGNAHTDTWIAGWAPVLGVYGLSFICALTGCCLFLTWRSPPTGGLTDHLHRDRSPPSGWGAAVLKPIRVGGARCAVNGRSAWSASTSPTYRRTQKWDRRWYPAHPGTPTRIEVDSLSMAADIILWPESAIPNYYQRARSFPRPHRSAGRPIANPA